MPSSNPLLRAVTHLRSVRNIMPHGRLSGWRHRGTIGLIALCIYTKHGLMIRS